MSRCECNERLGFVCAAHDRSPGAYEDCPFMEDVEKAVYKHFKEIKNGRKGRQAEANGQEEVRD